MTTDEVGGSVFQEQPMETGVTERWQLNPVQWDFVHCRTRFSFYVGGVGAGKTTARARRRRVRCAPSCARLSIPARSA